MWVSRLRWRMRGAWLWPTFAVLTVLDGLLLRHLPPYEEGPGTVVGGLLLAGFANLFLVAVLAPLAGRLLRRRRRDLPRIIADNYSGTVLVVALSAVLVVAGVAHLPARAPERAAEAAARAGVHRYVAQEAPAEYRRRLASVDVMRLEEGVYRSCVPGPDPRRWFCLFVNTQQRPAGVTRDPDQAPNAAYQVHGGFR